MTDGVGQIEDARTSRPPRALAPDLARGAMLLLIVLANIPWFLYGADKGIVLGHPFDATGADRVVQSLMIVLVDTRALPMFALLFGYGMVQFARAQEARGTPLRAFKAMLVRRHVALLMIGAVHAALLWYGDVLGAYGLLGLVLVPMLFLQTTRAIKVVRGVLIGLLAVFTVLMLAVGWWELGRPADVPVASDPLMAPMVDANGIDSYAASILPRLGEWAFVTGFSLFVLHVPIALLTGWIWARDGVLDRPGEHLRRLRLTTALGLPVAWLGGVPMMLVHTGAWLTTDMGYMFLGLQALTGLAGGLGYAAVFGLLAARLQRGRGSAGEPPTAAQPTAGPVTRSVAAVGKRSLSAYLWQSVAMAPLLAAWGVGWGASLGSAAAAGIAVLIWLLSVVVCASLERVGRPGPAEVVLRGITYGRA